MNERQILSVHPSSFLLHRFPLSTRLILRRVCRARIFDGGVAGRRDVLRGRRGGFPSGAFEERHGEAHRHGEVRIRQAFKDAEVDADHATRLPEERRARSALGSARVVDDAPRLRVRDVPLRGKRFDEIAFGEMVDENVYG